MPTREIALEEHTINNLVSAIVNTSVDDGKGTIKRVCEVIKLPTAGRLRVLRAALAEEKDGQARSSLLTALRSAIRSQEKALDNDDDLAVVYKGEHAEQVDGAQQSQTVEDIAGRTQPEPIPARPETDESDDDVTLDQVKPVGKERAPLKAFAVHEDLERIAMMSKAHDYLAKIRNKDAVKTDITLELENDWTAFVDEIRERGVLEPIKVLRAPERLPDEENPVRFLIIDGRHRWEASKDAGLSDIPYEVVDHTDARDIMEGTIAARRNYTKAQKAFIAVLFHPELLTAKEGRPEKLGTECLVSDSQGAIAKKYGVGERTMRQAIEVVRLMEELRPTDPKRVEAQEMAIWAGSGLPAALSALKGGKATANKPLPDHITLGVASRHLKGFATVSKDFAKWNQAEMMAFRNQVTEFWDEVDDGFADFLTLCRVRDNDTINEIIAARELAEVAIEVEGGAA